ncbi:hypothetical protein [Bacillus pumilus]|uniref:hypothetical protein n=1 Tax=Bacillus pumilus TaxID=1408 RepID=UPI0016426365|nr:hypothetical protein [Bacillus pumilus]
MERRMEKVVEARASPAVNGEMGEEMGEGGVKAGEGVEYSGGGRVELIYDYNEEKL